VTDTLHEDRFKFMTTPHHYAPNWERLCCRVMLPSMISSTMIKDRIPHRQATAITLNALLW